MSGSIRLRSARAPGNAVISSTTAIFSACEPATCRMRTAIEALFSVSRMPISFQACEERCIASATCAAVTTSRGDRNQPVPRIPMTPGSAARSCASKSRVMLTVEGATVDGSTQAASMREETTGIARTQTARTQTPRRRMMQPPGSHRGWVYKRARNPTPETHPPQYERPQETTQENRPKRNDPRETTQENRPKRNDPRETTQEKRPK